MPAGSRAVPRHTLPCPTQPGRARPYQAVPRHTLTRRARPQASTNLVFSAPSRPLLSGWVGVKNMLPQRGQFPVPVRAKIPCIGHKIPGTLFLIRLPQTFQLQSLSVAYGQYGSFKYRFAWLCRGVLHVKVITQSRETHRSTQGLRLPRQCPLGLWSMSWEPTQGLRPQNLHPEHSGVWVEKFNRPAPQTP